MPHVHLQPYGKVKRLPIDTITERGLETGHLLKDNPLLQSHMQFNPVKRVESNIYGTFTIKKSGLFPGVELISYKKPGGDLGHKVLLIDRPDTLEYYNSTGNAFTRLPENLQAYLKSEHPGKEIHSNEHKHQGPHNTCVRHAITRACLYHMTNSQYNDAMRDAVKRYSQHPDEIVFGITNATIELKSLKGDKPQQSLRNGGVVFSYGRV